jgi:AcrR family transcriptional regulator
VIHSTQPHRPLSPRRQREREQRRGEILGAAEQVFAARGFHEASVESIAEAAGFATGTIYLYFEDKEALYVAAFAAKVTQMVGEIEARVRDAADPLAALRGAVDAQLEFHDRHRAFFEIFAQHRPAGPGSSSRGEEWKRVHECLERHTSLLCSVIEAGQKRKLLRKCDSGRLAVGLIGMLLHITRDALHRTSREPLSEQAAFVTDIFLHGAAARKAAA